MEVPDFRKADYVTAPPANAAEEINPQAYGRAVSRGLYGALIGCLIFALVGHWIQIGFVSILVGGLVGTQMMRGSGGIGGRKYQWTAVAMTYLAVSFAMTLDLLWVRVQQGHELGTYVGQHVVFLVFYTVLWPIFELQVKVGYGLLGIVIVFFGLQAAWRIAKGGKEFDDPKYDPRLPGDQGPTTLGLR